MGVIQRETAKWKWAGHFERRNDGTWTVGQQKYNRQIAYQTGTAGTILLIVYSRGRPQIRWVDDSKNFASSQWSGIVSNRFA